MRFIYIAAAICLLALGSCSSNSTTTGSETKATEAPKEPAKSKLGDAGTQSLMALAGKYYSLKNALVATKAARTDSAATELALSAEQMSAALQKDSANGAALRIFADSIATQSKLIPVIKDETCEKQRIVFEVVSRNMFALLKGAELKNGHVYKQYCPMAFNEKGAYWLSNESEILNPYFGKKMLECGEVTDSL